MLQASMLIGNTFVYFQFRGLDDISTSARTLVVIVLSSVCAAGVGVMALLRPTPWNEVDNRAADTPAVALRKAWGYFWTKEMLQLR